MAQGLQITSPEPGTVVVAGQTITISVAADPSIRHFVVFTEHPLPNVEVTPTPGEFKLTIPKSVPAGVYNLTAWGANSSTDVASEPVQIDVEREDTPIAAEPEEHILVFRIGSQRSLRVLATFQDKSVVDVTRSSKLSFSSTNAKCASVDQRGHITARSVGACVIQVTYTTDQAKVVGAAYVEVEDR